MISQVGQTITVVNKSGKVVSTSKHLISVFKEARSAYNERKAEIKAVRNAEIEERRVRHALKNTHIDDRASNAPSRKSTRSKHPSRAKSIREAPPVERGYTDSFYANDDPTPGVRRSGTTPTRLRFDDDRDNFERKELARRNTEGHIVPLQYSARRSFESEIDMDLAYGELPPPLPASRREDEFELRNKVTTLQKLLDEANCVHHSATATIESLQKNPDAMAAVALTLAEISNLATKMSPGVIATLKSSFPAVMALLASPQFMIAAGVGVGVTIVALGGYKIIKKIQERANEARELEEPMQLQEIDADLGRIELWRRGIADVAASSAGTTVDGEYITPAASRRLIEDGLLKEDDLKSTRSGKSRKSTKSHRSKTAKSTVSSKTTGEKKKKKESSGLKLLFKTH